MHEAPSSGRVAVAREGAGASASVQGGAGPGPVPHDEEAGEKAEPCPFGCPSPPRLLFPDTFTNSTTPSASGEPENPETTRYRAAAHVEMRPEFQKRWLHVKKPARQEGMICGLTRGAAAKPDNRRLCRDTRQVSLRRGEVPAISQQCCTLLKKVTATEGKTLCGVFFEIDPVLPASEKNA